MKMKKTIFPLFIIASSFSFATVASDELKGDAGLACEAILCLSANDKPSECADSIKKFFSIHDRKPWKTIKKRKEFLALCPISDSQGMPEYQDLIANNADKCSPEQLNKELLQRDWRGRCYGSGNERECEGTTYFRISDQLPSYCNAYFNHEYNQAKPKYIGSSEWVEQSLWRQNQSQYGHWK
ncbi:TPA: conjugal transfer protein TrbM [Proteus mirabilis]|uniref:TrbM/KikA/MpfK family conjugal transfer protein n=1 Tax=Proteus mirabilis TaxID=584 RepID=UPI000D8468D8|nr:TrbM/KikA/MpfK family conjugal transfer protein [Proteus mirabilis]EMA4642834.1 conjugal transfer protein TrbM [Proteus mirabilis]MBG5961687.1 conjugal transfer protein TrbM [Proteus mirabilis]MBL1397071.1 conjugal transfer protein TrbM [Proteus mirabilis]MBQ0656091.1 conjugal transfer protein TrbM [Proteus mirabilis]MDL2104988.1 TrbM/KikA/MpfK family conjugal transfer protein [Proteus mirabilis]